MHTVGRVPGGFQDKRLSMEMFFLALDGNVRVCVIYFIVFLCLALCQTLIYTNSNLEYSSPGTVKTRALTHTLNVTCMLLSHVCSMFTLSSHPLFLLSLVI